MARLKLSRKLIKLIVSLLIIIVSSLLIVAEDNKTLGAWLSANQPGLYEVFEVNDGDTITVNISGRAEKVRMIGVDTPELHHPQKPVQCFAAAASQFTKNLIGANSVRLEADQLDDNRDLYGRLLRYVFLPDGTLVNAEIIKQGYGFAYTHFPFARLEEFRHYERMARLDEQGLWGGCKLIETSRGLETSPQ